MKVCMIPPAAVGGVDRHIKGIMRHLPEHGVEFVRSPDKTDILHYHAACLITPQTKAKVVYTNHGIWNTDISLVPAHARTDTEIVIHNLCSANVVICPSRWQAAEYERVFGIKCRVIPNGIEPSDWGGLYWLPPEHDGLWGKNRSDKEIFNPADFFELARKRPGRSFVSTLTPPILGFPDLPNMSIIGVQPFEKMQWYIASSGCLVTTASREFFGIQTLEANACGVPVLARRGGGNSDLVSHRINGWLYETPQEMTDGFDYLLANRAQMKQSCREMALCFRWEDIAKTTYQVYEEVLGYGRRAT